MNENSVYVLRSVALSERHFDQFEFADDISFLGREEPIEDFRPEVTGDRQVHVPRLAGVWHPKKVKGFVSRGHDYPTIGYSVPAFSQRAVDGLRDFLEPNGELLPLITPRKNDLYWAYNLRKVASVIDESRSSLLLWPDESFLAQKILHHEFIAEQLESLTIFRVPHFTSNIYVTDRFVERAIALELAGLHFVKVWPWPVGTDWERVDRDKQRGSKATFAATATSKPRRFSTRKLSDAEVDEVNRAVENFLRDPVTSKISESWDSTLNYVESAIYRIRAGISANQSALLDEAFRLGVIWGRVLVNDLGWIWAILVAKNGEETLAVVKPDQSLAVPILIYFKDLVTGVRPEINTLLTFNMIRSGAFQAPAGALNTIG